LRGGYAYNVMKKRGGKKKSGPNIEASAVITLKRRKVKRSRLCEPTDDCDVLEKWDDLL